MKTMRLVLLYLFFMSLFISCHDTSNKLTFFKNMSTYPRFDSINDRDLLQGFDRIIVEPTNKVINKRKCAFLSTTESGAFNVQGYVWMIDSIVYIECGRKGSSQLMSPQILFDLNQKKPSYWIVKYNFNEYGVYSYLEIFREKSFFRKEVNDSVTIFRIRKGEKGYGFYLDDYRVQVSLKEGIVSVLFIYENGYKMIDLLPKPRLIYKKNK